MSAFIYIFSSSSKVLCWLLWILMFFNWSVVHDGLNFVWLNKGRFWLGKVLEIVSESLFVLWIGINLLRFCSFLASVARESIAIGERILNRDFHQLSSCQGIQGVVGFTIHNYRETNVSIKQIRRKTIGLRFYCLKLHVLDGNGWSFFKILFGYCWNQLFLWFDI